MIQNKTVFGKAVSLLILTIKYASIVVTRNINKIKFISSTGEAESLLPMFETLAMSFLPHQLS